MSDQPAPLAAAVETIRHRDHEADLERRAHRQQRRDDLEGERRAAAALRETDSLRLRIAGHAFRYGSTAFATLFAATFVPLIAVLAWLMATGHPAADPAGFVLMVAIVAVVAYVMPAVGLAAAGRAGHDEPTLRAAIDTAADQGVSLTRLGHQLANQQPDPNS